LGTLLSYGCGCSGHGGEVHGVARGLRRDARDAISLRVLMWKFYALLRMRPQSISWAEGFVVNLADKSIMTNLASEAIDARCGDCV
jgi:hypothetical protein